MLILLDIDGVMVPAKSWKSPEILDDGFPAFSLNEVGVLLSILDDKAEVVLTTSHKSHHSIIEWKSIFANRGLTINNLTALPANEDNLNRKDEIMNWYKSNKITDRFVIIDDDKSLHELPNFLKDKWLETNSHVGLTNTHLAKMESILNSDFV